MAEDTGKPLNASQVLESVSDQVKKVDASSLQGEVRVLKKSQLKKIIQGLVERYASSNKAELMQQRDQREQELAEAQQHNEQLQALLTRGQDAVKEAQGRCQEIRIQIERFQSGEGEQMLAESRQKLAALEQKLQRAQSELQQAQSNKAEADGRSTTWISEIKAMETRLRTDKTFAKVHEFEEEFRRLDNLLRRLMCGMDFFAIEDEWTPAAFDAACAPLDDLVNRVGGAIGQDPVKMAKAVKVRDQIVALGGEVKQETKALADLIAKMNSGEAGVTHVKDMIEKRHQLIEAESRLRILTGSLMATVG